MRVSKPAHQRKAELILAARELFDRRGVENTRVSDIVGAVGVAQGVFYYYFSSKDEMVREVVRQVNHEMDKKATSIINDDSLDFCQKLSGFIELILDLLDQFLEDGAQRLPDNTFAETSPATESAQRLAASLLDLVEQGARTGYISTPYPRQTGVVLMRGFLELGRTALPTKEMVYAITQQALGIPGERLMEVYYSLSSQ